MNPLTTVLAMLAVACSGGAVYLFARSGYVPIWRMLVSGADDQTERYQSWVDELFIGWTPEQARRAALAARIAVVVAVAAGLLLAGSIVFAAAAGVAMYWIPMALYRHAKQQRLKHLDEQVPEAVAVMVASVRAGHALPYAIAEVAKKMAGTPVAQEFGVITKEHDSGGMSIEDALARASRRVPVESFTMITNALIINSRQGGDLLHILERMADATRELLRLQKKIETETSEVRAQEKLILAMTPLFGIMGCLFDPGIPDILFHSFLGNVLLAVVFGIQIICVAWIRKIVNTTI